MKLVYCPRCDDVFRLRLVWRRCDCGLSGGRYELDNVTAVVGGEARVFGIANPFFWPEFKTWSPQKKAAVHRKYKYGPQEIWWGEFEGDVQIKRRQSSLDPDSVIYKALSFVGDCRKWWLSRKIKG